MEVYPNSTLYNDDQVLEAMLQGDVQLAAPSLSKFETFTKVFRIFDLPFMFKNIEAVDAFQNSETGQAMKESMVAPRPAGPGILAQRAEAVLGQRAADAARGCSRPQVPGAALGRDRGADGSARRLAAADGLLRGLRRPADRRRRRAGKHLVEHLRPEVLRSAGRHHRDQPRRARLPGRGLGRLARQPARRCAHPAHDDPARGHRRAQRRGRPRSTPRRARRSSTPAA